MVVGDRIIPLVVLVTLVVVVIFKLFILIFFGMFINVNNFVIYI